MLLNVSHRVCLLLFVVQGFATFLVLQSVLHTYWPSHEAHLVSVVRTQLRRDTPPEPAEPSEHRTPASSSTSSVTTRTANDKCSPAEVDKFVRCASVTVMKPHERIVFLYLFRLVVDLFEYHNITFAMAGATLVGTVRDRGLIPWDDDGDMIALSEDRRRIKAIVKNQLWPPGRESEYRGLTYNDAYYVPKFYFTRPGSTPQNLRCSLYRPPRKNHCWPYLDLLYFDYLSKPAPHFRYWNEEAHIVEDSFPYSSLFPLREAMFENMKVYIPHQMEPFMPPAALHSCCTRDFWHKMERKPKCRHCVPCACLQGRQWRHEDWPS